MLAVTRVFRELDADFNLSLSPDEFVRAVALMYEFGMALEPPHKILPNMERKAVLSLFRQADLTRDGSLDMNEWLVLLLLLAPSMLSLITAHAATPAGAPLTDWRKLRPDAALPSPAPPTLAAASTTTGQRRRATRCCGNLEIGPKTGKRPSMWRPAGRPEVARLVTLLRLNQPAVAYLAPWYFCHSFVFVCHVFLWCRIVPFLV